MARLMVARFRVTGYPPGRAVHSFPTTLFRSSRGPIVAVAPIARATESWVEETTVVELTVTPAPKEALAPAWKFVPVTVIGRAARGATELGERLEVAGTIGKLTVALAEVPSAKVAVTEELEPGARTVL